MVTPKEIEEKEFSRSVRGYDRDEVDEFLDLIILDMQDLITGNESLKKENEELKEEIEDYKKNQKKTMETLESAKKLMKDISDSAEKRADRIIQDARNEAEIIMNRARGGSVAPTSYNEAADLHDKVLLFKTRYRQMLRDELDNLDSKSDDLLSEIEKEFMPGSLDSEVLDFSDIADDGSDDNMKIIENETVIEKIENVKVDPIDELEETADKEIKSSPLAKDTVVLDAAAIDEMIAKTKAEMEDN